MRHDPPEMAELGIKETSVGKSILIDPPDGIELAVTIVKVQIESW
jgi:hypothetical protein